ncbi:unnamed protein product [Rotaria socialis]|uniref:Uncharacterized protein n=1 Tax=Rotaria socialis TaxID=392032 RepID=A0A820NXC3_9BILA|nr:unnamed protein product [Rotaria socialis]CAF4397908.1 unnamed protein product [Rotaria socialis]
MSQIISNASSFNYPDESIQRTEQASSSNAVTVCKAAKKPVSAQVSQGCQKKYCQPCRSCGANHETVSSLTDFLIGHHEVNKELLIYFKNEELSLKKIAENNRRLFGTLIKCINSFEGTRDYLKAIGQLDSASVNKHNELLLFDACRDFWLSKYKIILKEITPSATKEKVDEGSLSLNSIKYLITSLIRMQRTTERDYKFSKGQLENFSLKKEYAPRLQMLLPWLSNSCILQNLMELDDSSTDKKMFRQIKNGTYIKLYIDNILGLLLDAKDIQNDTGASKEIIMILIIYVRNINQDDAGFANLFTLLTT